MYVVLLFCLPCVCVSIHLNNVFKPAKTKKLHLLRYDSLETHGTWLFFVFLLRFNVFCVLRMLISVPELQTLQLSATIFTVMVSVDKA